MTKKPLNVLFVCADDLRPAALGCYGNEYAITPNFDRLATSGATFEKAYCHQALCGPSRAALMTGRRLDGSNALAGTLDYRDHLPDVLTIPQIFKNTGHHCVSFGKVNHLHPYILDAASWSEPEQVYDIKKRDEYVLPENRLRGFIDPMSYGTSTECADVSDDAYQDGQAVTAALEKLDVIGGSPFFLAVGFKRPHLPFSCPKRFWDLHDPANFEEPEHRDLPIPSPGPYDHRFLQNMSELRKYTDIPDEGPVPESAARRLRHAYAACASYIDAQLGRLLDEIERRGLHKNTLIVFWADHGMHLGENGFWGKKILSETATRVPLLMSLPGQIPEGTRVHAPVGLVDLFPTIAEIADLPAPQGLEGSSLVPMWDMDSNAESRVAFSQCRDRGREIWGCSLRTSNFRYNVWFRAGNPKDVVDQELYNLSDDPWERNNLAGNPDHASVLDDHARWIRPFL